MAVENGIAIGLDLTCLVFGGWPEDVPTSSGAVENGIAIGLDLMRLVFGGSPEAVPTSFVVASVGNAIKPCTVRFAGGSFC